MGRSGGPKKRRPSGKRGWRKIDVPTPLQSQLSKSAAKPDKELFYIDKGPRRLSKKELSKLARQKLVNKGHKIDILSDGKSTDNATKTNHTSLSTDTKSAKCVRHPIEQLSPHQNYLSNLKKNTKTVTKPPRRNPDKKYRDIWGGDDDSDDDGKSKKRKKIINSNLSIVEAAIQQRKAGKGLLKGNAAMPNRWVPKSMGIALPHSGESVNPYLPAYIALGKQSERTAAKQQFKSKWGDKATQRWFAEVTGDDTSADTPIQNNNKTDFKKLEQQWRRNIRKIIKSKPKESNGKKLKFSKKNIKMSAKLMRSQRMLPKRRRGKIYGCDYKLRHKIPILVDSKRLGSDMRRVMDTKRDNPLSHFFYELQSQNRVQPHRKGEFKFKRKAFIGPRYKVQSRIGTLHHDNVNTRLFKGIDDDSD